MLFRSKSYDDNKFPILFEGTGAASLLGCNRELEQGILSAISFDDWDFAFWLVDTCLKDTRETPSRITINSQIPELRHPQMHSNCLGTPLYSFFA